MENMDNKIVNTNNPIPVLSFFTGGGFMENFNAATATVTIHGHGIHTSRI